MKNIKKTNFGKDATEKFGVEADDQEYLEEQKE